MSSQLQIQCVNEFDPCKLTSRRTATPAPIDGMTRTVLGFKRESNPHAVFIVRHNLFIDRPRQQHVRTELP